MAVTTCLPVSLFTFIPVFLPYPVFTGEALCSNLFYGDLSF